MNLVDAVYLQTSTFPKAETYGLTSQLRRSAISIPSNIAEGYGLGLRNYERHLRIPRVSVFELRTQLEIARRQNFLPEEKCDQLMSAAIEISRMMEGLLKSLRQSIENEPIES